MSLARQQQIEELFIEAADLQEPERRAFLDEACAGDESLRQEVESLLAHDEGSADAFSDGEVAIRRGWLEQAVLNGHAMPHLADGDGVVPQPVEIGRYRIIKQIGEGGMGTVFLAEQDRPRRRVALKMIRPGVVSRNLLRRFRLETEVLGRLQHPGIAQVYEAGEIEWAHGTQPYFAMEYIEGVELRRHAKEHELGTRAKLELVARVCDAVHHAHQKGVVHRDLKPDNILVVPEARATLYATNAEFAELGQPKILDFGVARATDSDMQVTTLQTDVGQLVGTLTYMSPEAVCGDPQLLDTRCDVYALGVILYELLAGRPPFELRQRAIPEAARIIREDEPTRLSSVCLTLRGDIDTIASKAMEKDRDRRYQSAAELAADIRRHLASEPIAAHPPSSFYQLSRFARRNRGLVAGLALAFVILIVGTASSLLFGLRAMRGERLAISAANRLNITAAAAVGQEDPVGAIRHLEAVPEASRGWEWRYLASRFMTYLAEWPRDAVDHTSPILARTQDGAIIAVIIDGSEITLVDTIADRVRASHHAPGVPLACCLSADASHLAAVMKDSGQLLVWRVAESQPVLTRSYEPNAVTDLRFSEDGSLLAVMGDAAGFAVIDSDTGDVRFELDAATFNTWMAAFDPIAARVAVVNRRGVLHTVPCLRLFDFSGKQLATELLFDGCRSLAYSPDGGILAVGQEQRMIRLFDANTLAELKLLNGHSGQVTGLAFSADGKLLASAADDASIRVWAMADGKTKHVIATSPSVGRTRSLMFDGSGEMIAAGSLHRVRLFPIERAPARVLGGHSSYVYRVIFAPAAGEEMPLLASSSHFGEVRLWNALTGRLLAESPFYDPHRFLAFTPDGDRLLVRHQPTSDTEIPVVALDTAAWRRLDAPRATQDAALFTKESSPFGAVAGGTKGGEVGGEVMASSFDGTRLAVGLESGQIRIDDMASGKTIKTFGRHDSVVSSVAFDPSTKRIVSGDEAGVLKVWDIASGAELASTQGHAGEVYSLTWHPEGDRIASGGNDNHLVIWDAETLERLLVLRGHSSYVHSVCFSPDGTLLASGSGDGTVRVWDSIASAQRRVQIKQAEAIRRQAEPIVDRVLKEFADPLDAADAIRADTTLLADLRHAALRILLRRSGQASIAADREE